MILLFFLKCGLASRLPAAVMCPIFSETDDTYEMILFVIVKGGLYSPIKHLGILAYYLTHYLPILYKYPGKHSMPNYYLIRRMQTEFSRHKNGTCRYGMPRPSFSYFNTTWSIFTSSEYPFWIRASSSTVLHSSKFSSTTF